MPVERRTSYRMSNSSVSTGNMDEMLLQTKAECDKQ